MSFGALPHERLLVYQEASRLLTHVREAKITDAQLRDQALRAAKGVCLNIAEGAGRRTSADKARVYGIARAECCEVGAALDIALLSQECLEDSAHRGIESTRMVYALLNGLILRFS